MRFELRNRPDQAFHLHTSYTDGKPTVEEYFAFAAEHSVGRLVFLEHIRRNPTYEIPVFAKKIHAAAIQFGIEGVVGFEAKILKSGELDIDREHLELAQVVGIAEHGFDGSAEELRRAFETIIATYPDAHPDKGFVWVHPGLYFKKHRDMESPVLIDMLQVARNSRVQIETNRRYHLPDTESAAFKRSGIAEESLIVGVDGHSLDDLRLWLSESQIAR